MHFPGHPLKTTLFDKHLITAETFDKYALEYQAKYGEWDFYHDTYDDLLPFVSDNDKVFEFACGPGNICKYLCQRKSNLDYVGIDLSPNMISLARQSNPNCHFEVKDSRKVTLDNANIDVVVAGFYLPYMDREEVPPFFRTVSRMLRNEGTFYCSYAAGPYKSSGLEISDDGDHLFMHHYPFDFIEKELRLQNLEIVNHRIKHLPLGSDETSEEHFVIATNRAGNV